MGPGINRRSASLSIDGNEITEMEEETYQMLGAMGGKIRLGRNPFECSCHSLALHHFVRVYEDIILDADNVTINCDGVVKPAIEWRPARLCPRTFVKVVIPLLAGLVILILVLVILFLYYKRPIMVYIYSHKRLRSLFSEDLVHADLPYDAFISYSNEDKDYVEGKLVPGLEAPPESEGQPKFKCLVHVRDFDLGLNIMQQIGDAVDSSRRTVIVLSKNFCRSQWYHHEFQLAHARKRVVVVVHGELPTEDEMGSQMRDYIRANTYLLDTDPWFWQKLRYALPHKGSGKNKWLPKKSRTAADTLHLIENGKKKNGSGGSNGSSSNGSAAARKISASLAHEKKMLSIVNMFAILPVP